LIFFDKTTKAESILTKPNQTNPTKPKIPKCHQQIRCKQYFIITEIQKLNLFNHVSVFAFNVRDK